MIKCLHLMSKDPEFLTHFLDSAEVPVTGWLRPYALPAVNNAGWDSVFSLVKLGV